MKILNFLKKQDRNIALFSFIVCDECGKINPPMRRLDERDRVTICKPPHANGMYHGKTMRVWLRLRNPFYIS